VRVPDLLALEWQEDQVAEFVGDPQLRNAGCISKYRRGQRSERSQDCLTFSDMRLAGRDDDVVSGTGDGHDLRNDLSSAKGWTQPIRTSAPAGAAANEPAAASMPKAAETRICFLSIIGILLMTKFSLRHLEWRFGDQPPDGNSAVTTKRAL